MTAAAVVVAAGLRFTNLAGIPPALNQDEAVNGYDAYSLFLTGRDHLGHPFPIAGLESFGDWVSPLLTFLTAPAVGLFGLHVTVLRAVTAGVGVIGVPVVYLLATELFGRRSIGAAAAGVIAVSPWDAHLTQWAIPPALVPTMVALMMLTMVWAMRRRSARGIVVAALVAALTILSYPTMKLYVPLLGLAAVVIYYRDLLRIKREALVYAAIVLLAIAGPHLYLSTIDPGGRARLEQVSVFKSADVGPSFLLKQYRSYFSPRFLFEAGDGDPMHSPPGFGVALKTAAPFLLAGLIWLLVVAIRPPPGGDRRSALFVLAALVLYPIPGSLTVPNPHMLRAAHLIPLLALVAAVGLVAVVELTWRLVTRTIELPATRLALMLLWILPASWFVGRELVHRYNDYFNVYPNQVLGQFQYGLQQSIAYAHDHEGEYDQIWITDANQPYIYVLFFNAWDPTDVHNNLVVHRTPPWFNGIDVFHKYHFGDPPNLRCDELPLLTTVSYPTGETGFEIRGGTTSNGLRMLMIDKPQGFGQRCQK